MALGLGRLAVQSSLGEALRAEIDVTSLTPEEAATLRMQVAAPEAFRAAGIEFNPALAGAQVTLQRRADGRSFVRVTGDRPVLEPFVDVVIEAQWASGRLVREYTMLFDPPVARQAAAPAAALASPVISASPVPAAPAVAPRPVPPAPTARPAAPAVEPARAAAPAPAVPRTAAPAPAVAAAPAGPDQVVVRPGDTLSRIANRTQRPGVSLDQMLVSLFRGNPQAFMDDNMNRLRSGAVLSVPGAEQAQRISTAEAREIIQAQSADFNAYRQRLAGAAPAAAATAATRSAAGQVQAQVEDKRQAAAPGPDKLTLTQGALKASAPEAKLSKAAESKDASARLAELSRNVEELTKLQGATAPALTPSVPASVPAPATAPAAAVSTAVAAASAPQAPVTAPVAVAPPPAPAADGEPGFLEALLGNPLVLPGAGILVALIAGLGIYRLRGKSKESPGETSFLESRLQPDSFFGAAGGQRIDTRETAAAGPASASASTYSLSQLDAIGDVDPVAEADVYLAYGRDLQAEEILKEAMRTNPERMAIRTKLLEVYAKRRDGKAFELLATQVYALTRGEGDDWAAVQEIGHGLDPDSPLYRPGARPNLAVDPAGRVIEPLNATTMPHTAKNLPPAFEPASDATLDTRPGGNAALELDLEAVAAANAAGMEPTQPLPPAEAASAGDSALDFQVSDLPASTFDAAVSDRGRGDVGLPPASPSGAGASRDSGLGPLDFDLSDLPLDAGEPAPAAAPQRKADADLDFGDFGVEEPIATPPTPDDADPLNRKLELAEEFRQIGDLEGARDLLEEVVAKAEGALKAKAQGMLDRLG
jgi:pilus assembly protein FimV